MTQPASTPDESENVPPPQDPEAYDDDLDALLDALPPEIRDRLRALPDLDSVIEVVMDLGRRPEARFGSGGEEVLSESEIDEDDIAYVVDQSHNLKGKIEAMLQTVSMAQALYAKAALVDHARLADAQHATDLVRAESILQDAFATDVRPARAEWRRARSLPVDPIDAFRQSGYLERVTRERGGRASASSSAYA